MTKKKGTSTVDAPRSKKVIKPNVIIIGDSVRVWSEVGVTIAVSDDPPQFLRYTFGHERIAKNSTQEEIRKTARLVDEFNEAELERRIDKFARLLRAESVATDEDEETVRSRVHKRIERRQGGGKKKTKAKK